MASDLRQEVLVALFCAGSVRLPVAVGVEGAVVMPRRRARSRHYVPTNGNSGYG